MEFRDIDKINQDIVALSAVLKILDKKMVEAKNPEEIEMFAKMIKEHEKIFHELENEKIMASKQAEKQ
ncbi:hypothetical protein ACFLYA_00580 [Candidatus Dependentiae bacterium]